MEPTETQESSGKEGRFRTGKTYPVTLNLHYADFRNISQLQLVRMRQLGEDVSRDRIVSEALQSLVKAQNAQEEKA